MTDTTFRAETDADERILWRADAAVIQDSQYNIVKSSVRKRMDAVPATPSGCGTLERLVELRFLHQTQRAANSVRSRGEQKTQGPQDAQAAVTTAAKRQSLCAQMADVIRRSGTGLERCARWRSAPGTMNPSEVSELSGNSANAETVAKDRVRAVSGSGLLSHHLPVYNSTLTQALELRRKFFTTRINFARLLTDGLVGPAAPGTDRSPLSSGSWGFMFSNGNVYVGQGTWVTSILCTQIADMLQF